MTNFLIIFFIVAAIFLISLSVFVKIKYLSRLNNYFAHKKQISISDGKKFAGLKQKFYAVIGIIITVPIFMVLMMVNLPNELNGLRYGVTGDEYDDLILYAKSSDMTATVKEFKEYKLKGFETGRDYGLAKKMGISKLVDYKQYQENQSKILKTERELAEAKKLAERNLADAKKRGFNNIEEMQLADKIENDLKAQKEKERLSIEADKRITESQNQQWKASCKKYAEAKKQCAPAFNFDACVSRLGSSVAIYELNC